MKNIIKKILRKIGLEIVAYTPRSSFRSQLMTCLYYFDIDYVIDVGANTGQYSKMLRDLGYAGEIISFEPSSYAHQILVENSLKDLKWKVGNRLAISNKNGKVTLNVSENSQSSSCLPVSMHHIEVAPLARFISEEVVDSKRLDSIFDADILSKNNGVYLKVDVQGFEKQVIEGARDILSAISVIKLELSLSPMYVGEDDYIKMIEFMKKLGYVVYGLSPVLCNNNGRVEQIDVLFCKD